MSNITVRVIERRCGRDYVAAEYRTVAGCWIVLQFQTPVPREVLTALLPTISVAVRERGQQRNFVVESWLIDRRCAGLSWRQIAEEASVVFPETKKTLSPEAIRKRLERSERYAELRRRQAQEQPSPPTPPAAKSPTPTKLMDRITDCLRRHGPSSSEQLAEWTGVSQAKVERNLQNNTDHFRLLPGHLWTLWD